MDDGDNDDDDDDYKVVRPSPCLALLTSFNWLATELLGQGSITPALSIRVVIIPTLIINWDPVKWLGQDGFVITGQTNIECDICPRLMSRFLCFCNRLTHCSY